MYKTSKSFVFKYVGALNLLWFRLIFGKDHGKDNNKKFAKGRRNQKQHQAVEAMGKNNWRIKQIINGDYHIRI